MRCAGLLRTMVLCILTLLPVSLAAQDFRCASPRPTTSATPTPTAETAQGSGKIAAVAPPSTASAVVLFARFADQDLPSTAPDWAAGLLDPSVPGSVAHYYDAMSFGRHRLRGQVVTRRYAAPEPASAYLSATPGEQGDYGRFALEILRQADHDLDFSRFDNDGPDGIPNSGDDDGIVDAVFLNLVSAPAGFLLREATGIAGLGFDVPYVTDDVGAAGAPIRIDPAAGTVQAAPDAAATAGAMAHEYGHLLGLGDLYNTTWTQDPTDPADDSAGIGRWGLMGWGTSGWPGAAGPASLSALSRLRLGWVRVEEPASLVSGIVLEPVAVAGHMLRVPIGRGEYYLIEYRTRASYYDRGIPAEGVLVWRLHRSEEDLRLEVDLVCADGNYADAGFPLGTRPAPATGGDNLDFWAHDAAYREAHAGNLGDATDPFDGARSAALTPATNPAAVNAAGDHTVSLEDITIADGRAHLLVRGQTPDLVLSDVAVRSDRVAAGTDVPLVFGLTNVGRSPARGLRAEISASHPALQVIDPSLDLLPLNTGESSIGFRVSDSGFPRLRFDADLSEEVTADLDLSIYADGILLARSATRVTGLPAYPVSVTVTDPDGLPLAEVPVTIEDGPEAYFVPRVITDVQGRASMRLPAGTYSVHARPPGEQPFNEPASMQLRVDGPADAVLALSDLHTLSGHVHAADGSTPGNLSLVVRRVGVGTIVTKVMPVAADGSFSIRVSPGTYELMTRARVGSSFGQEHGSVEVTGDTTVDLLLPDALQVETLVVDESGNPVDHVGVRIGYGGDYASTSVQAWTSGGQGARFEVPAGSYTLEIYATDVPWLAADDIDVEVRADTTVRLILTRGVRVALRLVDDVGQDHAVNGEVNITVSLSGAEGTVQRVLSPGPARVEWGLMPGRYRADVAVSRSFTADATATAAATGPFPSQTLGEVDVRGDTILVLHPDPGAFVEGVVRGPAGWGPVSGWLTFRSDGTSSLAPLAGDGGYALRLLPADYQVMAYFSGEDAPPTQSLGSVSIPGDTTAHWSFLAGQRLDGRLLGDRAGGFTGLSVSAASTVPGTVAGNSDAVDSEGRFTLRLAPGRYLLRASANGATWRLSTFEVPSLDPLEFVLPAGATLEPRVTDDRGRAIAGRLRLFAGHFDFETFLLRYFTGDYEVQASIYANVVGPSDFELVPGRYHLVAETQDGPGRLVQSVIADGLTPLVVSLPPPPSGPALTGRLQVPGGSAAGAVLVMAWDMDGNTLSRTSSTSGAYDFELAPGRYRLGVVYSGDDGPHAWVGPTLELTADTRMDLVVGDETVVREDLDGATPRTFALGPSYPNPANASVSIPFTLEAAGRARLDLYDLAGQRIRTLVDGERPPGAQQVHWDGHDSDGRPAASGVYFYRLAASGQVATRKLLLLR